MSSPTMVFEQTVQKWRNSLGIRISTQLAKAVHISLGTRVKVEAIEGGFLVRISGKPKRTLNQKLKAFNPKRHGDELVSSKRVGVEVF